MTTPVGNSSPSRTLIERDSLPPSPKRRAVEKEEVGASSTSLPPPIVNVDALKLSYQETAKGLDIPMLFLYIELGFDENPSIEPKVLGQNLALIPELLKSFWGNSYTSIKKACEQYMIGQTFDEEKRRIYFQVISEICHQNTLNSPCKDIAHDFHKNPKQYTDRVTYWAFQDAIKIGCQALTSTEFIQVDAVSNKKAQDQVSEALSAIDELLKLQAMAKERDGQLIQTVIQDTFPQSVWKFKSFCRELKQRCSDSPLEELAKQLRRRAAQILDLRKEIFASEKKTSFFDIEAEAIWRAGCFVLRSAIDRSSKNPRVAKLLATSEGQLTDQLSCQIWETIAGDTEISDPTEIIRCFLSRLNPEFQKELEKELSFHHTGKDNELDQRAQILFDAFIQTLGQPLSLTSLKQWSEK